MLLLWTQRNFCPPPAESFPMGLSASLEVSLQGLGLVAQLQHCSFSSRGDDSDSLSKDIKGPPSKLVNQSSAQHGAPPRN